MLDLLRNLWEYSWKPPQAHQSFLLTIEYLKFKYSTKYSGKNTFTEVNVFLFSLITMKLIEIIKVQ